MNKKNLLAYILHWHWQEKYIKEQHFFLILSFLTGVLTAFSSIFLKKIIYSIHIFLTNEIIKTRIEWLYFIFPIVGVLLSGLFVKYVVKDDIKHGVTTILYAISQRKSRLKTHNLWSSLIASAITIGMGGSVGAEAPGVLTGSSIGSNIGRLFKLEQKKLMLLIGCGASGAIAGVFKAPIAGLLFTIEVLMLDLTTASVLPLLISSVTSASIAYIFTGPEALFEFTQTIPFYMKHIPYTLMLGLICALVTVYFVRSLIWIENIFTLLSKFRHRFLLGAILLSTLVFLFPPLYGEGYDTISQILNKQYDQILNGTFLSEKIHKIGLTIFLILVVLTKVYATTATTGGGGCGGIFAPSLFLGCAIGFIFSHVLNHFFSIGHTDLLSEENFSLMGMAGMMAAILHAPLTAIFLIAELTGGFSLFFPLMIVSTSAYFTILFFQKYSIYSLRLAQKGKLITHDKNQAILTLLHLNTLVEKDFHVVSSDMTLGDMVKVIAQSEKSIFPVVDEKGIFKGMVLWDNIKNIMFRPELYDKYNVGRFMVSPLTIITNDMSVEKIIHLFDDSGAWNFPLVDTQGHYLGILSKSKIFTAYKEMLQRHFTEDENIL